MCGVVEGDITSIEFYYLLKYSPDVRQNISSAGKGEILASKCARKKLKLNHLLAIPGHNTI